jgi:CRISPR-associated protein Csy2
LELQTYKGKGDYVHSIIGTGNPLDKDGSRPAFVEEARCHLEVSLLIETSGMSKDDEPQVISMISHHLHSSMKVAGGDIMDFKPPFFVKIEDGNDEELNRLIRRLMPGYAIIERRELMVDAMEKGQDAIEALLDFLSIHHQCEQNESGNVTWTSRRKSTGWIVPIATGFHGITELDHALNQRDPETPHRFAESVVTLGEFKMPHRIRSIDEILWHYHVEPEENLYLCQQVSPSTTL